jgi:hypothetical protein
MPKYLVHTPIDLGSKVDGAIVMQRLQPGTTVTLTHDVADELVAINALSFLEDDPAPEAVAEPEATQAASSKGKKQAAPATDATTVTEGS